MTPNGFTHISQFKAPRRLMIGIEGLPDTGKTEFSFTAPANICSLAVDRGYEHVVTKANPPVGRQKDIYLRTFKIPQPGQNPGPDGADQKTAVNIYKEIWQEFYGWYRKAIAEPSFHTVVIDGDSDTWDLQQLASFGKVVQVPPIQRTDVNAARRVMIARGFDSGKNIIFTYRLRPEYEKKVKVNSRGEPQEVDERTGEYKRAGFSDQDYLVQVQLRALYEPNRGKLESDKYGVRILKCKPAQDLIGMELWGPDCCFSGLIEAIYPESDPSEWGL